MANGERNIGFDIDSDDTRNNEKCTKLSISTLKGLPVASLLKMGVDLSRINFISAFDHADQRHRSIVMTAKKYSMEGFDPCLSRKKHVEDILSEEFPIHMTPLMNEDQLWGCFYNFPQLYADIYSPVISIRNISDVPPMTEGVLTRDTVTACLSYLKRTPILGDFVYIKLDLSSKLLTDVKVLQHYKYLVYLDLSSNLLTELTVLSQLLYLQFLSVAFNRLESVLEYDTPQWFLTEVHYKYNSVMTIRDLSAFWSITVLDLSHNNIKYISGLRTLRCLRRLDLSFNHIERLENLNHLRLLWLDVSYNNISSFEFGDDAGLWTLLHLEYLNLNENSLTSMKIFSGCTRLQEIHARNNLLSMLLELAVYMRQLRRLLILDFRSNPVCSVPGYKDVVINTFPCLLNLDSEMLEPVEQRSSKMDMSPDIMTFATRRLLRLLYIEQLSRAHVSPYTLPADTREIPIIVLVGYEAVGKGTLARKLAKECSSNVELAVQHTTAHSHFIHHYIEVSRSKFDDMLLRGEFLTYGEMDGESYGLSRGEACVRNGRVRIATMDLISALMLKLRGLRPYLILASSTDKCGLAKRQEERKIGRNAQYEQRHSMEATYEISTLQVLLSGRIIINGILNEILHAIPDEQDNNQFIADSECSLFENKPFHDGRKLNKFDLTGSSTSSTDVCKSDQDRSSQIDISLFSLYKQPNSAEVFVSDFNDKFSHHFPYPTSRNSPKPFFDRGHEPRPSIKQEMHRHRSMDFTKYSPWKGSKSSKSVTFTSQDNPFVTEQETDASASSVNDSQKDDLGPKTVTSKTILRTQPILESRESDLWLAFLMETGLISPRELIAKTLDTSYHNIRTEDLEYVMKQFGCSYEQTADKSTSNIKDNYEDIHRECPGLFWDTINMDNPSAAYHKLKRIIREIVQSQKNLKPMWDIDFANMDDYPIVETRLQNIRKQIASQRLFH
ncbi:uncharacterized protein [Epargyreus clarus]|uniref:uncharacterized protein n=1 Tax=Epargyreus clarus TaxID=520877 RepID=UPI003C30DEC5